MRSRFDFHQASWLYLLQYLGHAFLLVWEPCQAHLNTLSPRARADFFAGVARPGVWDVSPSVGSRAKPRWAVRGRSPQKPKHSVKNSGVRFIYSYFTEIDVWYMFKKRTQMLMKKIVEMRGTCLMESCDDATLSVNVCMGYNIINIGACFKWTANLCCSSCSSSLNWQKLCQPYLDVFVIEKNGKFVQGLCIGFECGWKDRHVYSLLIVRIPGFLRQKSCRHNDPALRYTVYDATLPDPIESVPVWTLLYRLTIDQYYGNSNLPSVIARNSR